MRCRLFLFFVLARYAFLCERIYVSRGILRAVYQRQPLKLHHGKIQRKKYGAKDKERGNERHKISFHALRNHTKKTITAISTDVNKAGPAQGYVPPSCVLPSSVFMHGPSHLLVTDAHERGALSPLGYVFANYKTRKYRIRQMKTTFISIPEKMTISA